MAIARVPALFAVLMAACIAASAAGAQPAPEGAAAFNGDAPKQVEKIGAVVVDRDGDTVLDRKSQRVRIQGTVSAAPSAFGTRNFQAFVQDASGGIMLFSRELHMPLSVGDRVEVVGYVNQFRGAAQLQDIEVRRLGSGEAPAAQVVELAAADSWKHMARRVTIEGTAGPLTYDTFGKLRLIGDDGASLSIFVPPDIARDVPWKRFARGSRLQATGVVSIYKHTWPYDGGFQLVVTDPRDMVLLEGPAPAWHAWAFWAAAAGSALLGLALGVFYLLQRRQKAREHELATLSALSSAFAGADLDQEQLARRACDILTAYGVADAAIVHVLDENGCLRQLAASAVDPQLGLALHAAEPLPPLAACGDDARRVIEVRMQQQGLILLAVQPLQAASGVQGYLVAVSPHKRRPNDMQERTLLSAVKLLALALENCRIQERARIEQQELQHLVVTDELTRLHNRRFLEEYLRVQVPLAQRRGGGLAFLAIDIDHFKVVNDTHGHDVGDRVLAGVAACLREAARSSDLPVRMGGEEFLVVVAEHDAAGAMVIAERLRQSVEAMAFESNGQALHVTISVGVALFGMHGSTAAALLRASDEAMYVSKRGGRNRSTLATYSELTA